MSVHPFPMGGVENGTPVDTLTAVQTTAAGYARNPETIPAFPSLMGALDLYMQRIPWWVLVVAAVLGYRWLTKGRG